MRFSLPRRQSVCPSCCFCVSAVASGGPSCSPWPPFHRGYIDSGYFRHFDKETDIYFSHFYFVKFTMLGWSLILSVSPSQIFSGSASACASVCIPRWSQEPGVMTLGDLGVNLHTLDFDWSKIDTVVSSVCSYICALPVKGPIVRNSIFGHQLSLCYLLS